DADRVRAGHRRVLGRLHDHVARRAILPTGGDEQVRMLGDRAARLAQQEAPQRVVGAQRLHALVDGLAGRRLDACHDDVAHLAAGVAADDGDRSPIAHRPNLVKLGRRSDADAQRLPAAGGRLLGDAARADSFVPPVHAYVTRPDLRPPVVTVRRHERGATAAGLIFMAPLSGPGMRGVYLVDDSGDPVFFHPTRPAVGLNFRAAVYRGKPVLTWWEGKTQEGLGLGTHVVLDSTYRLVQHVHAGNGHASDLHEFLITNRDTALVTAWEPVETAQGIVVNGI